MAQQYANGQYAGENSSRFEVVRTQPSPPTVATAVVASGNTLSGEVDVAGRGIAGVDLGDALTSNSIGLLSAADGSTFRVVKNTSGANLAWTVSGNTFLKFDPPLQGYERVKITLNAAEANARSLLVVMSP